MSTVVVDVGLKQCMNETVFNTIVNHSISIIISPSIKMEQGFKKKKQMSA